MENSSLNPPNYDAVLSLKPTRSSSLFANGTNGSDRDDDDDDDDIEMIEFQGDGHYTSLKDVLPSASTPPSLPPPAASNGGSWKEIPIRDPLVQHAAWAYLQPIPSDRVEDGGSRWMTAVGRRCSGLCKCFNDVVLALFKSFLVSGKSD